MAAWQVVGGNQLPMKTSHATVMIGLSHISAIIRYSSWLILDFSALCFRLLASPAWDPSQQTLRLQIKQQIASFLFLSPYFRLFLSTQPYELILYGTLSNVIGMNNEMENSDIWLVATLSEAETR